MTEVRTIEALRDILASTDKVIVDCWSPTCGPCKAFLPVFEKVSTEVEGVTFLKLNIAEVPEAIKEFGLRAVPTIMGFKDGEKTKDKTGLMNEQAFYSFATDL